jgi:hypothetical protein
MLVAKCRTTALLSTLIVGLLATGCDDGLSVEEQAPALLGSDATTVRVLLTDAPSDYIGSAEVDIGRVELLPAGGGGPIVLSDDGTDGFVNLLDLQGPATMPLAEAEIDPSSFVQLRLFVEAARVELADGYAFRDGSTQKDLQVPSGAQTGIKLNLHSPDGGPLDVEPGETVIVLDFDVNQSFVLLGNPETPAGVRGVIFTPTIRVTGQDVAASISGTVSTSLEGMSVEGLTVRAEPTDGGTVAGYQSLAGTALTADDGSYTIHFLVPGSYDVTVDLDPGLGTDPQSHSVVLGDSENATGADFEIIDVTGSISGRVSTALASSPIAGLTVTAVMGPDTLTTTVADDSTYTFDLVLPGTYVVTVSVGNDLLTNPAFHEVEVGNGEDVAGVDFDVVEDVRGSISGTVTTALAGVSVEGLTVTATPAAAGTSPVTTTTGTGGAYTFALLDPGDYTVSVAVGAGFATNPATRSVQLLADEAETGVDFDIIAAGS